MIVALVDDLLFSSKIRAIADRVGQKVTFVRDRGGVVPKMHDAAPELVIIDLDRTHLDPIEAIRAIRNDAALSHVRIVAYSSHVQVERIRDARDAGADTVLARSGFVTALPELLTTARQG